MRTFLALLGSAVLAAAIGWGVTSLGYYTPADRPAFRLWTLVCWALFVVAYLLLRLVPARAAAAVVLIGAALIGGAAIAGPPNTSTDSARYAWDGIVQDAGVSPYAHTPNSHATAGLRTDWLFPAATTNAQGDEVCTGTRVMTTRDTSTGAVLCTTINRATVPTIYPALAELYFAAVRFVVPTTAAYWPLQASGLILDLAITVLLVMLLRRHSLDVRWAALWAWCPLVASEAVTNSHIDLLAAGLALAATGLAAAVRAAAAPDGRRGLATRILRTPAAAGIALGGAIATKLFPVVAAPALLRRRPVTVIVASVVTFLVLYVPYVLTTGPKVIGFLPGYLSEEGVDNGSRFALLYLVVHSRATTPLAVVILLLVAVVVWRVTDPASPWLGQLVMIGAFLLVLSPRYPWYALLLIPFVAMTGRWEWLSIALALSIRQFWPAGDPRAVTLGAALVLIVAASIVRSGPGWWGRIRDRAAVEWRLVTRRRPTAE